MIKNSEYLKIERDKLKKLFIIHKSLLILNKHETHVYVNRYSNIANEEHKVKYFDYSILKIKQRKIRIMLEFFFEIIIFIVFEFLGNLIIKPILKVVWKFFNIPIVDEFFERLAEISAVLIIILIIWTCFQF